MNHINSSSSLCDEGACFELLSALRAFGKLYSSAAHFVRNILIWKLPTAAPSTSVLYFYMSGFRYNVNLKLSSLSPVGNWEFCFSNVIKNQVLVC